MIGNSDDEANFPRKLLLTDRQVANLRKAFANHTSTGIKLSKTRLSKIIQSGGFLGRILVPLLKTGLPLLKSVIESLGLLGLTSASSAIHVGVQKKIYGSGSAAALITSYNDIQNILKVVKSLEDSGVLLKGVTETIHNDISEQKGGFLSMLLGTLGASFLGDILTKNLSGKGVIRAGEGSIRAGYGSKRSSLEQF